MKAAYLIFFLLPMVCFSQFKVTILNCISIPESIHFEGTVVDAVRWQDLSGDHIVITAMADEKTGKEQEDTRDGALYGYHYLLQDGHWTLTWRVYDFVKACGEDMDLYFVNNTFTVTDLNNDGNAEVWIMYKNSCHGDVSPVPMKIIMYENNKKFAARGATRVRVSDKDWDGGDFSFDEAFRKGPEAFRTYAEKLWKKNKIETWGR